MARRRMLAPINTIKHFVARTNTTVLTGVVANVIIADAAVAPASTNTFDVLEGSVLKAVHIEFWIVNGSASNQNTQLTLIVEKIPANGTPPTVANMLNLQAYTNKKNILFTFQGNLQSALDGAGLMAPIRDWILIPKGKQRMGLGDSIVLSILPVAADISTCGMFIYKEYR